MKMLIGVVCLMALGYSADSYAQQPTHLNLPGTSRWDVTGQLSMLNRNTSELSRWDHWYSVAAVNGTAGYYWSPHFKTELELGFAGEGSIDGTEETPVPGQSFPYSRYRDHRLRETTVGATALYQFFENQWVHPFVGSGVELVHERHIADAIPATSVVISSAPVRLPAVAAVDSVSYSLRPLVTGGVKFYVTPHAFIRTEVRASLTRDFPAALQWRAGLGVDF